MHSSRTPAPPPRRRHRHRPCLLLAAAADKGRERQELLEWPAGVDPAADHWQSGTAWQTSMEQVPFKPARGGSTTTTPRAGPSSREP